MILMHNAITTVENYTITYTILKNRNLCDGQRAKYEYGIKCTLLGADGEIISSDAVKCVTPRFEKICDLVRTLKLHQVFPVHLREIICDLIEVQLNKESTNQIPA